MGGTVDQAVLRALRDLPAALGEVIERRSVIAEAAHGAGPAALLGGRGQRRQPHRRGRGAHQAVRALLQVHRQRPTEDKKHIDLSSEPLILVCAAGLEGSTADDVAKEVAIYRAHKASPVVIATDG